MGGLKINIGIFSLILLTFSDRVEQEIRALQFQGLEETPKVSVSAYQIIYVLEGAAEKIKNATIATRLVTLPEIADLEEDLAIETTREGEAGPEVAKETTEGEDLPDLRVTPDREADPTETPEEGQDLTEETAEEATLEKTEEGANLEIEGTAPEMTTDEDPQAAPLMPREMQVLKIKVTQFNELIFNKIINIHILLYTRQLNLQ